MRLIGALPQEPAARAFRDYLLTRGIDCTVDEGKEGWSIWVENDDQVEQAKGELETFKSHPDDPRYQAAQSAASDIRTQRARQEQRRRANYIDVRTKGMLHSGAGAPLTVALIALCLVVAVASGLGDKIAVTAKLTIVPLIEVSDDIVASSPDGLNAILHGQVWRLVSPILLHFGVLHLIFNLMWLADLGARIEGRKGTWFMLLLVLASGIISNLAQYEATHHPYFGGMSGVVYALFGYAWMKGRFQPQEGIGVLETTTYLMLGWMAAGYIFPGMGMANWAHLVGLLVGVAFGAGPYLWMRWRRTWSSH